MTDVAEAKATCTNSECRYDMDGICVEGAEPDSCPFRSTRPLIVPSDQGHVDEVKEVDDPATEVSGLPLHPGKRLDLLACVPLLGAASSRMVSLIAPRNAGKTTLIAGIYEMFLEGRPEDLTFRSSRTLVDFERISHLARAISGRITPDTERTKLAEGLGFYHIEIVRNGARVGLLLSDRPGENFVQASSSIENAQHLSELVSASSIAYLIDGEALSDPDRKAFPKANADSILEAMVASGLLSTAPALALVLTKADLLEGRLGEAGIERFNIVARKVSQRFGGHFSKIRTFVTAASPTIAGKYTRGSGLAALVRFFLEDARPPYRKVVEADPPERSFEGLRADGGRP